MTTLDRLYRQEERIGDRLSDLELLNTDDMTPFALAEWNEKYKALEAMFAANQTAIKELEGSHD